MDYLLAFAAHEFVNFRELEVRSLLTISGMSQECIPEDTNWSNPYVKIKLPSDEIAAKFIERSMLVKFIYSVWATASTFDELLLKHQLHIIFEFTKAKTHQKDQLLLRVYYGREVGESSRRRILNEFHLSKRTYLGNTTMDVCLAGIIANACLCGPGDIVWDPFLGTGGMVLAASVWGAYGAGNDIDYALVHGIGASPKAGQGKRNADECLRANYRQYNLLSRYLDVLVADAASLGRLLRCSPTVSGLFDAIVTDPPYGVRERTCRVASEAIEREPSMQTTTYIDEITGEKQFAMVPDKDGLVPVPHDLPHFPHKENYPLQEIFGDLLELASLLLKPRGRLVFWVPVSKSKYSGPHSLPTHPRFELISVCEQALNRGTSRFLLVMEKLMPEEADVCPLSESPNETIDGGGMTESSRREEGFSEAEIEAFINKLSLMDSNNWCHSSGVGEREGRILLNLVRRRHFGLAHGIGRSGDITAIQPKASGSSLINRLSNALLLDWLRRSGAPSTEACLLVPMATGMTLTLCLLTLKRRRGPQAKYVIWPRIDQKSCLKCITAADQDNAKLQWPKHSGSPITECINSDTSPRNEMSTSHQSSATQAAQTIRTERRYENTAAWTLFYQLRISLTGEGSPRFH
ncbi:tRNA guanosine-2'-O-methyltransferase TRM11 [Echinococcus granulosus]|uniref:tRNA guanosine-2'-O-methyltransferase TRM11 n=1 Tax=Echinococcus granulosus TaxID=6210 RepID=W6UJK7_ECHGR|nr:tRNA guanosine-2'-O-methyltransferase TRM11 [Echinococcus granulosus]EUB58307.1 tRNA guanosine-2'-O-methyltransferase TRM11 [Echinococcus granulosus]